MVLAPHRDTLLGQLPGGGHGGLVFIRHHPKYPLNNLDFRESKPFPRLSIRGQVSFLIQPVAIGHHATCPAPLFGYPFPAHCGALDDGIPFQLSNAGHHRDSKLTHRVGGIEGLGHGLEPYPGLFKEVNDGQ